MAHEVAGDLRIERVDRLARRERVRPSTPAARCIAAIDDSKPEVCPHQAVRHAAMEDATSVVEGTPSVAEFRCDVVPVAVFVAQFDEEVNGRMEVARVTTSAVTLADVVCCQ